MAESNTNLVQRFFTQMCNERRLELASELFAADHVYEDPSIPGVPNGPDGMRGVIATYQKGLPDARWAVDEQIVAGDRVVTRWTGTGTHKGELNGIPATGARVSVHGIWIHRIADGRIVHSFNVWDTLGMLRQLGVIPPK